MVKVKEVKHSDEDVSSDSGEEQGEYEVDDYERDGLIPMALDSEEGE
jgi:hypothetical protein